MSYFISITAIFILLAISFFGTRKRWFKQGPNWLSRIMHFSGGIFVAMFLSNLITFPFLIIVLTFLAGIFWEIAEYIFGFYMFKKTGTKRYMTEARDTAEDLILDVVGASVFLVFLRLLWVI